MKAFSKSFSILSVCVLSVLGLQSFEAQAQQQDEASVAVKTDEPGNVFTDIQTPLFRLVSGPSSKMDYEISSWQGASLAKGSWDASAEKPLSLKQLPPGSYSMKLSGFAGAVPFSVVVDPSKRAPNPESYFAMDTAQSWLCSKKPDNPRQPKDGFKAASDLCKLAGLYMVRERMSWGEVADKPYELSWGRYMVNAKLLSERGIKISGMFHDAPKWAKRKPDNKLPDNLFALHSFAKSLATAYKGVMADWEFWNEEDGGFLADEGAWDFAAAQKAAYLGFKEGDPSIPVLNGAFCVYPLPVFDDLLFQNGCGDYFDILNHHIYNKFVQYPKIVSDLRDLLGRYGMREIPIWITENGSNYEGHGKMDSFMKGLKEHDAEQELLMAEFTPKSQILLQSEGIARDFFFVLPAYNERGGGKAWGMLRWDYTAKPAYVAFANLTYQLASAKYLGTYELGEGIRGFLYEQPDSTQTLAFWSESELDKTSKDGSSIDMKNLLERPFGVNVGGGGVLSLFSSCPSFKLSDVMGLESQAFPKDGVLSLKATRYPAYLSGLRGLSPSKPAPSVGSVRKEKDPKKDLTVVLKPLLLDGFAMESKTSASISGESGKIAFEIYNFDDVEKIGALSFSGKGGRLEGLPSQTTLPPRGKVKVEARFFPESFRNDIVVEGSFNGKAVSPVKIPAFSFFALEKTSKVKSFDFENPARWRSNSSGDMKASYDEAQKALKVSVKFKPNTDFWVYPEYVLKLPEESLKGAVGVSFEIKAEQKGGGKSYAAHFLMAVMENVKEAGESKHLEYRAPSSEWQKSFLFLDDAGFDPANVKLLRLGMNPKEDELVYWVKNVKIYFSK